ncbi:hypothetical protein GCM10007425_03390 [Lysinibacillus alkalisoli]|uniref:Uncharacterized protein n=1 Tax=Lysinibacillus alkalisoli TaxID=1911548 RepID=A0A917D577_9BACI|nr:hypothetical protein [Lysinibacillus alkalisoli]GGG12379.1 hypothetical protein GCM10007425_03390 [Lysinibacillus alkalisoli]
MTKATISYGIIGVLLLVVTILYNEQLASIPLLLLSAYLFFLGIQKMRLIKKQNSK